MRTEWSKKVKEAKDLLVECDLVIVSLGFDYLINEADGVDASIQSLDVLIDVFRNKSTLIG